MTTPRERPINLKQHEVRAILEGRKTQTRRVVKDPGLPCTTDEHWASRIRRFCRCPLGRPGDRLWVRETWLHIDDENDKFDGMGSQTYYRADQLKHHDGGQRDQEWVRAHGLRWRSPIHMPRWASRILLEVADVRVERLQDISSSDCWAEGVQYSPDVDPWHEYRDLWESINGPGSWATNPWVWVVSFNKLENSQ